MKMLAVLLFLLKYLYDDLLGDNFIIKCKLQQSIPVIWIIIASKRG